MGKELSSINTTPQAISATPAPEAPAPLVNPPPTNQHSISHIPIPNEKLFRILGFGMVILFFIGVGTSLFGSTSTSPTRTAITSNTNATPTPAIIDQGMVGLTITPTPAYINDGKDTIRKQDIDSLSVYLRQYYADHLSYPQSLQLLVPEYISVIATDPSTKKPYRYVPSKDHKSFTITATYTTGTTYTGDYQNQQLVMQSIIQSDIAQIQKAVEQFYSDNKTYPAELSLLHPKYIAYIKKNPATLSPYTYAVTSTRYTITTQLPSGETYTKSSQ